MNTRPPSARLRGAPKPLALATLLALGLSSPSFAQIWGGGDGQYTDGLNWTGNSVPDTNNGATAVINGGVVTYTPGGDLLLNNGGSLTLNGGSWTQAGGIAWIKIGQNGTGTLNINSGATFNTGTSENLEIGPGGTGAVNVNGGTFLTNFGVTIASGSSFNTSGSGASATINGTLTVNGTLTAGGGTLSYTTLAVGAGGVVNIAGGTINHGGSLAAAVDRTYHISGGDFTIAGEINPVGGSILISGGNVTANIISFNGPVEDTAPLELAGGTLTILSDAFGGMWNTGQSYVNFTEGSSAQLIFTSVSTSAIEAHLNNGWIRYNDLVDDPENSMFTLLAYGEGGSILTLASTVPEPSSFAALAGLGVLGFVASRRRRFAAR